MEFYEKLQELRKQRGLTQEELAELLYVSRTAVSKWESGRGMPNVESLKAISKYFAVSLDDLLSGEALLVLAEDDRKQREAHSRVRLFGVLDCSMALLFFLPFFGQKIQDNIQGVSLPALTEIQGYLKITYFAVVIGMTGLGVVTLALQNHGSRFWSQNQKKLSLLLHIAGVILFILGQQPYAAVFIFVFLLIKLLLSEKNE